VGIEFAAKWWVRDNWKPSATVGGMPHDQHHFVPAFLLREWESGKDDKLTSLRWARGAVVANRYKAKSVAKQRHLYTTGLAEGRPDNKLEREFMGRRWMTQPLSPTK
jgi:hypothetical protein